MSRSQRKPYITDQQGSRGNTIRLAKRQASRRVRKAKDVESGGAYRKVSDSWDIRDWCFYAPDDPKARRK